MVYLNLDIMSNIPSIVRLASLALAASISLTSLAGEVLHFPMDISDGKVTETVSGQSFEVKGVHAPENVPGAAGNALRLDGYSTYIDAGIGNVIPAGSAKMTASVWFAIETYPIVEIDVNTMRQVAVVSCIDEAAKTGFGFFVGFDGKYSFKTYVGGWPVELKADGPLPQYEWINLTAVVDKDARTARLFNNGTLVASSKANGTVAVANSTMRIGRSAEELFRGPFCTTSFNGIVDDITVWDEALSESTISAWMPENEPDLSIPAARFAGDPMRPVFHCMPGANWTNETHGMTYSNGRYHVFFQKNANGPYMARLHWGHLSSDNLYNWREERIALTPGTYFDIKGCWSGCVFSDQELTQGKPSIIYTGVDYVKAVIAQATPADDNLIEWSKAPMPIINGRPDGLSDDFRDPYFFRTENGAFIIVGSSKNGVGTTTLHAYNPVTRTWSNDGKTFFTGTDVASCGTFWEMSNITPMGDKWLFTTTPQNTSRGVAALYWVGTINADGTFSPDKAAPVTIELPGFARNGYGLLSPTVYQHDGKTIAMGIVPDKLSLQANYDLGYAHTYSLPREWSVDGEGNLCQKPYSGLAAMRCDGGYANANFALNGSVALTGVSGRSVEVAGEFTVGAGKCGFTLLDDGASSVKVYYDGASNEIVVDMRGVDRLINDSGVFDGYYHSALPVQLAKGETVKLNVYLDHSILDIFVNDRWATSVRIFAQARAAENVTVFADAPTQALSVRGWNLDPTQGGSGVGMTEAVADDVVISAADGSISFANVRTPATLSVYNVTGSKVFDTAVTAPDGRIDIGFSGFHIVAISNGSETTARKVML